MCIQFMRLFLGFASSSGETWKHTTATYTATMNPRRSGGARVVTHGDLNADRQNFDKDYNDSRVLNHQLSKYIYIYIYIYIDMFFQLSK